MGRDTLKIEKRQNTMKAIFLTIAMILTAFSPSWAHQRDYPASAMIFDNYNPWPHMTSSFFMFCFPHSVDGRAKGLGTSQVPSSPSLHFCFSEICRHCFQPEKSFIN
jgi:hypothetical protein